MRTKSLTGNRRIAVGPNVWTVDQLPPLRIGDLLAFQTMPGFEQWAAGLQNAQTWHWALVGLHLPTTSHDIKSDYQIISSINKGVATELLSAYQGRSMRVYRPDLSDWKQEGLDFPILRRCAYYGAYEYNWLGVGEAAITFLAKEAGIRLHFPLLHRFYCIQFCARIWDSMGFPLVKDWQYVTPEDMEKSNQMKIIWRSF